jgi:hypothetical protein
MESLFNKNFGNDVSPSGLGFLAIPSKALTNEEMRETDSVCKLNSTVNKNCLHHSGLVSSEQQRKMHTECLVALAEFHNVSESAVRDCSLLKKAIF